MPREYRFAISAVCGAALLSLAILPESALENWPAVCLFRNLFGLRCLGCGMTHALAAALHGHLAEGMGHNPGVVLVLPAMVAGAFGSICR